MNLSRIKALSGLSCLATAAGTSVAWSETIGAASSSTSLDSTSINRAYDVRALLAKGNDGLSLNLENGQASASGSAEAASATLAFSGLPTNGQTTIIGTRTYTWRTVLSIPAVANEVLVGGDAEGCAENLMAAILATEGQGGIKYGTGTVAHALVTAAEGQAGYLDVTALVAGEAGNTIVTGGNASNAIWNTATLANGRDASTVEGGNGTDLEGNSLGTMAKVHAVQVRCLAGAVTLSFDGYTIPLTLGAGGLFLWAAADDASRYVTSSNTELTATAGADATSVEITVFAEVSV